MKKIITKTNNSNGFMENARTRREFVKYEIRKFTIDYSKLLLNKGKNRGII